MKSPLDFQNIYRFGDKCSGKYFFSFVRPRSDQYVYFGVTASRHIGNAVARNRAKRIMREAVRLVIEEVQPGFDLVLVARPSIQSAGMKMIGNQLKNHLFNCHKIQARPVEPI
ncbi:MAG: ribonuclease P protein component [bacterium]